ncbi:hypothetical protein B0H19DRAFT_1078891 [Mycena capillaripes]|nr:hypothetical protein B0H19DRAFT_1078891 [Mycena capillaripes]
MAKKPTIAYLFLLPAELWLAWDSMFYAESPWFIGSHSLPLLFQHQTFDVEKVQAGNSPWIDNREAVHETKRGRSLEDALWLKPEHPTLFLHFLHCMGQYNSEPESICDSAASVAAALPILRAQSALAITCQGYDLGYKGGSPCILSFATIERPSQVFHFDLITLDCAALQPLFDILRSPSVTKAVFDGRLIASALLHDCGVELVNALDMQLADVTSRTLRGECAERQLSRLSDVDKATYSRIIPRSIVHAHPEWYQSLLHLNEAEVCTKEHGIRAGSSVWRRLTYRRSMGYPPLSSWACKYSTDRVYLISAIYADFEAKGYITPALAAQSARYLSLHLAYMPKLGSGHLFPILPLGIITAVPPGRTHLCKTCSRAFIKEETREDNGVYCLVCFGVKKAQEENDEISRRIAAMPVSQYDSDSDEFDDPYPWKDW